MRLQRSVTLGAGRVFDYVVVGKGLIGSAAVRYLSQTSDHVAIIGPDEPENWSTHPGVFSSHYDQGRITRVLSEDRVWAKLAMHSIQQYRDIEQRSGVRFYYPTGGLQVGQDGRSFLKNTEAVGRELDVDFQTYPTEALRHLYPLLRFPEGFTGLLETGGAGYINPRSLIEAQLKLARQQGATIIPECVIELKRRSGSVTLITNSQQVVKAKKVLLATGAYANQLLDYPLALTNKPRTILLAELSTAEVERLKKIPTLIYKHIPRLATPSIYMLPPIKYPDGNYYLKIGGGYAHPMTTIDTPDQLCGWFQTGGSQAEAEALKEVLSSLIVDLRVRAFYQKPCVTAYTPQEYPFIDTLEDGQLFVAAGGCGAAAKSSNELGRVAAMLVVNNGWEYDLDWALFQRA